MGAGGRIALIAGLVLAGQHTTVANPTVAAKLEAGAWRSLVVGGTNVHDFPLTPLGRERFANFPLHEDPSLRCEPPGMPRAFYHLSPMDFRFREGELIIRYETMDVVRTVRLDAAPAPPHTPHTPNGYATGHWEDDTLVVDTTRLAAGETTRDGVPKSAAMTLRETFQLDDRDGGAHLIVTLTITDPENFAMPFTSVNEFALEPEWELLAFDCQPTVY